MVDDGLVLVFVLFFFGIGVVWYDLWWGFGFVWCGCNDVDFVFGNFLR